MSNNKACLFIDGSNLYATAKALSLEIDFKALLKYFGADRAYYYTAIIENEEFSTIRPLIDWLEYNGYTVVTKPTKEFIDPRGHRKVKGNMDIELVVDALEQAPYMSSAVLFSGDGDFAGLVKALQRRGVHVTVVSSIVTEPNPMCADELRRAADTFKDLSELAVHLRRGPPQVGDILRPSKYSSRG